MNQGERLERDERGCRDGRKTHGKDRMMRAGSMEGCTVWWL